MSHLHRIKDYLAAGDVYMAFVAADRHCRRFVPSVHDLVLLAQTHRAAGRLSVAHRVLEQAANLDPDDILLNTAALTFGDEAQKNAAAHKLFHRPVEIPVSEPPPFNMPPIATELLIIVPVYQDAAATRACLESLQRARPSFAHHILVVDDASPDPAIRAYLDQRASAGDFVLARHDVNLGFAATVNRALALRMAGDVLLLNADTLLPQDACERLHALSRLDTSLGTITPVSNNGELTSYPLRNVINPLPSQDEIEAINTHLRSVNGDVLVDMPNGVGFCLYITAACLDAVGGMPTVYKKGYCEDVEFCLKAREHGFRNVAAVGVFVGHAGSRSFGARKTALVARNVALLETRFPGIRLETAAFLAADPLLPYLGSPTPAPIPLEPVVANQRPTRRLGVIYPQRLAMLERRLLRLARLLGGRCFYDHTRHSDR